MQRRILCFGDSNTWGVIPRWEASPLPSERYDEHTRWPCVMADCLNHSQSDDSWTLIEEGLGGRTTMYHPESGETYRLGDAYLHPCLLSHRPLDYVVLMLGTNDLQPRMHKTPFTREHLADGLIHLIQLIRSLPECGAGNQPVKILVVAPPPIKMAKGRPEVSEKYGCEAGVILSHEFASAYEDAAKAYHCGYLDAGLYAEAGDADGVHFTLESHPRLGKAIAEAILAMDTNNDGTTDEKHTVDKLKADIEM